MKIGSALAERVGHGEVGGYTPLGDSAWRLLQLAVEKPWSALDVPFVAQNERKKCAFHLVGTPFLAF